MSHVWHSKLDHMSKRYIRLLDNRKLLSDIDQIHLDWLRVLQILYNGQAL